SRLPSKSITSTYLPLRTNLSQPLRLAMRPFASRCRGSNSAFSASTSCSFPGLSVNINTARSTRASFRLRLVVHEPVERTPDRPLELLHTDAADLGDARSDIEHGGRVDLRPRVECGEGIRVDEEFRLRNRADDVVVDGALADQPERDRAEREVEAALEIRVCVRPAAREAVDCRRRSAALDGVPDLEEGLEGCLLVEDQREPALLREPDEPFEHLALDLERRLHRGVEADLADRHDHRVGGGVAEGLEVLLPRIRLADLPRVQADCRLD